MELVYLWVEKYKNIENQGFNFSPRFRCEYDKDKNELTIDENKEYVSIFPDNINVTAIVGKNGSGKSGILEIIINNLEKEKKELFDKNFIIVVFDKKLLAISLMGLKESTEYEIVTKVDSLISRLYHSSLNYRLPYENDKIFPHEDITINDIQKLKFQNIIYHIQTNSKQTFEKKIGTYFSPNEILILVKYFGQEPDLKSKYKNLNKLQDVLANPLEQFIFIIYEWMSYLLLNGIYMINRDFNELEGIETLSDYRQVLEYEIDNINDAKEYIKYFKDIFHYIDKIYSVESLMLQNDRFTLSSNTMKFSMNIKNLTDESFYLLEKLPDCFELDFVDYKNNIKYNDLSSGEKHLLDIVYYIEKIVSSETQSDNFLFLLDELDNELHPEWQKKVLEYLISYFRTQAKYIHFIITSHSPFILSDLPKENVIFLKNGTQEKPFKENEQTFGANIHTLLSHGFFMDGGLMGEFAKGKIKKVIKLLNSKSKLSKKSQKFCENIISIIGEPILQKTLRHQLNEKLNSNETELQRLERQQKEIQDKIDKLKGR